MEKKHLWILILVLIITGCTSKVPLTVTESVNSAVIASFELWIEDINRHEGDGELDLLTLFRLKEVYEDIKKTLENPTESHPSFESMESIFFTIESGLRDELNIPLLPLERYITDIQQGLYGFPLDDVDSVAKTGRYDAALDIFLGVSFPLTKASTSEWGGITKIRTKGKPKLTLKIKMISRNGNVIWRDNIVAKSDEYVVIDKKWFGNMKYDQDLPIPTFVLDLTQQAVKMLVEKNKNR